MKQLLKLLSVSHSCEKSGRYRRRMERRKKEILYWCNEEGRRIKVGQCSALL